MTNRQLTGSERFDHLLAVISGKRFLEKQGLGNEVPFFICPYKPEDAVEMNRTRRQLVSNLLSKGVRVLEIDLYDVAVEILKDRGIWEQVVEMEPETDKSQLKELLQGVLDPETHLAKRIKELLIAEEHDVLFLSGVGEVFPYIRSHNVLNNLQSVAKEKPLVMFFPGEYTHSLASGAELDLFGKLQDDKYYRAFNIFQYEA